MAKVSITKCPKPLNRYIVALYRPGPMDFLPNYVNRLKGLEEIIYPHPKLKPILEETYGITIFQEQIMYIAAEMAGIGPERDEEVGFTFSEADLLRKAMARKKEDDIILNRKKFISGAIQNGYSPALADQVFDNFENFARYGFPKGHATNYSILACKNAYLKANFPVEYMAALISEPRVTNKIGREFIPETKKWE